MKSMKSMSPMEVKRLRDLISENAPLLEQRRRLIDVVFKLARRLVEYFDHKVNTDLIHNELVHEEEGLRALMVINERVGKLFVETDAAPLLTMEVRHARILLEHLKAAGGDPKRIDGAALEKELNDLYFDEAQTVKAFAA